MLYNNELLYKGIAVDENRKNLCTKLKFYFLLIQVIIPGKRYFYNAEVIINGQGYAGNEKLEVTDQIADVELEEAYTVAVNMYDEEGNLFTIPDGFGLRFRARAGGFGSGLQDVKKEGEKGIFRYNSQVIKKEVEASGPAQMYIKFTAPGYKTFEYTYDLKEEKETLKYVDVQFVKESSDKESEVIKTYTKEEYIKEALPKGSVVVDGSILDANLKSDSNRTLAPFRAIFEALGAEVEYDSTTKTATGTTEDAEVKLTLDKKEATVNGETQILDVPAKTYSNKTYVPIRFVGESLGAEVEYEDGSVIITTK